MHDVIERLRQRREALRIDLEPQQAFELLALACSACCTQVDGGNKTCPPKLEAD